MYLKRLEITGFKSFADPFEIEFRPGITAVVGPNGCGKSNIADSVRWVLGCQSPRQLRAERMEDVIFGGSSSRKPLGLAEVILTLDNVDRSLPIEFDEVSIARRLFRAGDSEYLINGTRSRLMDVTDLIADRGLGSDGYWILEAKMVETILSSKPEDRRFLFDEAAGITKYKIQRHRAELRLEATAADLERIGDILSEVERNAGALRRQVAVLRKHERITSRLRDLRNLLEFREEEGLRGRFGEIGGKLVELRKREEDLSAGAAASAARLADTATKLDASERALGEARDEAFRLDSAMADLEKRAAVAGERKANLLSRAAEGREAAAEATESRERELEDLQKLRDAAAEEESDLGTARSRLEAARERVSQGQESVDSLRRTLSSGRDELAVARSELREAERSLASEGGDVDAEKISLISGEIERLSSERTGLESRQQSGESSLEALGKQRSEAEDSLYWIEEERDTARATLQGASELLLELDLQRTAQITRIDVLSGSPETAGREAGRISDLILAEDSAALAVGAYLDSFQDARPFSLDEGELSAEEIRAVLEASGGMRIAFLGRRDRQGRDRAPQLPDVARWLPDLLLCEEPGLRDLLARGCLAPDRPTALRWFLEGLDMDIVTPGGDVFRRTGVARLGVPEGGAGAVDRGALLNEAGEELRSIDEKTAEATDSREKAARRLGELEDRVDEARNRLSEIEQKKAAELRGCQMTREAMESVQRRIGEREAAKREIERRLESVSDPGLLRSEVERLSALEAQRAEHLAALEKDLDARLEDLAGAMRELGETEARAASLAASIESAGAAATRLEASCARSLERAQALLESAAGMEAQAGSIESEMTSLQEEIGGLRALREKAEQRREAAGRERAELLQLRAVSEAGLQKVREDLLQTRSSLAELSAESRSLQEAIRKARAESARRSLPPEDDPSWGMDEEALGVEMDDLSSQLDSLGPVNMLAASEFEEVSERLRYLGSQRKDLVEARRSLLEAIGEINETASQRFSETFGQVRQHFRLLFQRLFDGGEADILPVEGDDPLEGGVQIVAMPPGKKLENISALSGGERAMTAVALLFALYLVKPSPFCVLDELDAPLDDSNVDTFVDLVRGFSDRTQFLVVTHNKRTMGMADTLYGITMAEEGVSTMASVDIRDFEQGPDG
ncbi:chromosome segregation protein SMC [Candidatus Fermentibacterales bacterium]|nr:chromosome segregation protein SMC [Candidatus Fermentibacterales bacterium]